LYLSHFPGIPKLDLRVEAALTDPSVTNSSGGRFLAYEGVQQQGPTNKGFLFGDAIGREDKGGDAWMAYHLSPEEQVQVSWREVKAAKDFIPDGTTQNQFRAEATKQFGSTRQIKAHFWVQYEAWQVSVYRVGRQTDTTVQGEVTWSPKQKLHF
jgi:hypothetical protein